MASSRAVVIAGAGIGGLTAALTIARQGYRVVLLEQAERLEETGAGIQLSPNASRILIGLGLRERLEPHVTAPQELTVANARSGRVLARAPLGPTIAQRYGAPYWIIHRGDLQSALLEAVAAEPDIALRLATRVDDFATHSNGITVAAHSQRETIEERALALIGADGLWSRLRGRLGHGAAPRFAGHTAWRALVPADAVVCELSIPTVNLWFGSGGHVVYYPVKGGRLINVVAIMRDDWHEPGWSAAGDRDEILARFRARAWRGPPRDSLRRRPLAQMGAVRRRPPGILGPRTGNPAGRRGASHIALSGTGRRHGDRGRRRARRLSGTWRRRSRSRHAALRAAAPGTDRENPTRGPARRRHLPPERRGGLHAHARARRHGGRSADLALRLAVWLDARLSGLSINE